jgi:hypothetical protein
MSLGTGDGGNSPKSIEGTLCGGKTPHVPTSGVSKMSKLITLKETHEVPPQ